MVAAKNQQTDHFIVHQILTLKSKPLYARLVQNFGQATGTEQCQWLFVHDKVRFCRWIQGYRKTLTPNLDKKEKYQQKIR